MMPTSAEEPTALAYGHIPAAQRRCNPICAAACVQDVLSSDCLKLALGIMSLAFTPLIDVYCDASSSSFIRRNTYEPHRSQALYPLGRHLAGGPPGHACPGGGGKNS